MVSRKQLLSVDARLNTLSLNFQFCWVKIFQNVTQNLLSQNYVNLLCFFFFCFKLVGFPWCCVENFSLMNVKTSFDSKRFKLKNLVIIFWNFLILYTNLKYCVYSPESENTIWSSPTFLWAADFFWPRTVMHTHP